MAKIKNSQGRPTVKGRRIQVGFTLKPATVATLRRIARERDMTRSALVQEVLSKYLQEWET